MEVIQEVFALKFRPANNLVKKSQVKVTEPVQCIRLKILNKKIDLY